MVATVVLSSEAATPSSLIDDGKTKQPNKLERMSEEGPEDSSSTVSDDDVLGIKDGDVDAVLEKASGERSDEEIPVMPASHARDVAAHDWLDRAVMESKDARPQRSGKIGLRRSTTTAIPKSFIGRMDNETDEDADDESLSPVPLTRSKSVPERAAALEAIQDRSTLFRYAMSSRNVRESVRQMYSFMHNDFPRVCHQTVDAEVKMGPVWRDVHVEINREGLTCNRISLVRKKKKQIVVLNDDILGAARVNNTSEVIVHYMKQGRGKNEEKLKRRYRQLHVRFANAEDTEKCVRAIQNLVKWDARVPLHKTRKIKVVVNPHSGKRRGLHIWETWKPVFELAGIECDMDTTKYGGHARDIGKTFDLSAKYEAIVFVGGDGTVNEFMNGVFARDEDEWRNLVATTPVSLLCAGTDNAFGLGVGIPTHEAAVYCVVKRKIRPLDVLTCQTEDADGTKRREFACCGVSYGIGADIAVESEQTRWLGVHRYKYLKLKRGVFAPRPHVATIRYVLSDDVEKDPVTGDQRLQTYYEIVDKNAEDQHHIELCSVYDEVHSEKRWDGDADSIYNPASEDRFADQWKSDSANYTTVGASNVYFETKFYHPSDGNMDLIIARKGPIGPSLEVGYKYLFGNYLESSLVDYFKVKAMVINQEVPDPINVDGEVFPGPGPFRIEVVPRLLCVLSEK